MGAERLVVLAGRTLQSLARLHYDLAPLLAVDHRIKLLYSLTEGSDRRDLAERRALELAIPLTSWRRACELRPNLVISASADPRLHEAHAPLVLIPHGATYNRASEGLTGAAGTAREHLVGPNGEVPALMAMPGPAAMDRLRQDCPEALPHAVVTGDLCMERLRLSEPMRRAYRERLGVAPDQKLVVVSSTWGPYSLTGQDLTLPGRLLSSLPADEFALAYIPHPNIDADHGGNLLAHLRPSLRNGLIMVPPEEGWRATLIAADAIVGDCGSVTFYAANLGKPVLLVPNAAEETVAGTPQEAFERDAPKMREGTEAAAQIRDMTTHRRRGRADYLRMAWTEPDPGPSHLIPARIYELLVLHRPPERAPELLPPPDPVPDSLPMSAWHCVVHTGGEAMSWERYPATRTWHETANLVVDQTCLDSAFRKAAQVLLHHRSIVPEAEADSITSELFDAYELCGLVSVRTGDRQARIAFRDGARYVVRAPERLLDIVPSALSAALENGAAVGRFALRRGDDETSIEVHTER